MMNGITVLKASFTLLAIASVGGSWVHLFFGTSLVSTILFVLPLLVLAILFPIVYFGLRLLETGAPNHGEVKRPYES